MNNYLICYESKHDPKYGVLTRNQWLHRTRSICF